MTYSMERYTSDIQMRGNMKKSKRWQVGHSDTMLYKEESKHTCKILM